MKIHNIVIVIGLLTTSTMARFEAGDIIAENDARIALERSARGRLAPLRDAKQAHISQVAAPFHDEWMQLERQAQEIRQQASPFHEEQQRLLRDSSELERGLSARIDEALKPELALLYTELETRRAPIEAQLQQLNQRKEEVMNNYYKWKEKFGRAWDEIDEQDIGFRLSAIETEGKRLFASVDGDTHDRITATREAVTSRVTTECNEEQRRIKEALAVIADRLKEKDDAIAALQERQNEVRGHEAEATHSALSDFLTLNGVPAMERELILARIVY